jgi:hypothetical protein
MGPAIAKSFLDRPRAVKDLVVIIVLSFVVFALSAAFDLLNKIIAWIYQHDTWQLDELFTVVLYLVVALSVYAFRRHREFVVETGRRQIAESEKAQLIPELQRARGDVATLRKILPICPSCKRIRDTKGDWYQMETYMEIHLQARLNNGLCPGCARDAIDRSHAYHGATHRGSGPGDP